MKKIMLISLIVIIFGFSNLLFSQDKIALAVNNEKNNTELNKLKVKTDIKAEPDTSVKNNNFDSFHSNGINYNLPKTGYVILKIKDHEGTEVASLVNREQSMGNHFAHFSTINLNSGIYKYELILDEKIIANKLIIVN